MNFAATDVDGVWVIEPERHEDERGFFARTWDASEFAERGLSAALVAVQHLVQPPPRDAARAALPGRSARGGEARSLHGGRDLRRRGRPAPRLAHVHAAGSASSSRAENRLGALRPRGLRTRLPHARPTTPRCSYQISELLRTEAGARVRFDDPAFGIDWPGEVVVINERDRSYPDFEVERVSGDAGRPHARADGASSSRSAAASRATACARRCALIGAADPTRAPRGAERHAGPRLDGAGRVEHSRRVHRHDRAASASSTSALEPPRRQLQRARSRRRCRSPSCGRSCTRIPSSPTGSRTAPRTTRGRWGFCLSQSELDALEDGRVRGRRRQHARARHR